MDKCSGNGGRPLRCVVVTCLLVAATAGGFVAAKDRSEETTAAGVAGISLKPPAVIAARFHADWCRTCAAFTPVFPVLVRATSDLPVMYVTLDMTNEVTRRQAGYLAGSLGLSDAWSKFAGKVGTIALIDAENGRTLSTVLASGDLAAIKADIRRAVDASREGN